MITSIKNWFNKDKLQQQKVEARMKQIESLVEDQKFELDKTRAELKVSDEELSVLRTKEAEANEKHSSVEPWIEIKSDGIDPIKGMVIECDWNPAFIQFLKENGITSKDENVAVQKYIAMLYADIVEQMDQQIIEDSDKKPRISDYA